MNPPCETELPNPSSYWAIICPLTSQASVARRNRHEQPRIRRGTGYLAAPFIMAAINTRNVHRSNALLAQRLRERLRL